MSGSVEVRDWHHNRKGRIRGVVLRADETWMTVRLVGEHDIPWLSETNRLEVGALQHDETLTVRRSLMTPIGDPS